MATYEQYDAQWKDTAPSPRGKGTVGYVCIRPAPGVHEVLATAELSPDLGVHGDRWSRDENRDPEEQVTLMNIRVARLLGDAGQALHTPGDNILVDLDLSEAALPAGSRIRVGEALLQISEEPHTGCKKFRERFGGHALRWVNAKENRELRLRGVNCRVIEAGSVSVGDEIVVVSS